MEALDNIEKASFMLGCKIWIENFDALLAVVKEYLRPIADYLRKGTLPEDDRLAREIHVHVVLYQNQNTLMDSVLNRNFKNM